MHTRLIILALALAICSCGPAQGPTQSAAPPVPSPIPEPSRTVTSFQPEPSTGLSTPEGRAALREFWKPWKTCFPLAVEQVEDCVCEQTVGRTYPGVVEPGIVKLHFPLTGGNTGMHYQFQLNEQGIVEKCAVWGEVIREHGRERLPEDQDWWEEN